jgi:transporter family-2 protein
MDIFLALLGSGSAGSFLSIGAAANARLMIALRSPIAAATINFLVGFAILTLVLVFSTKPDNLTLFGVTPWWAFLGGLLGAIFVTINTLIVSQLGLTATTIVVVFGQMLMSVIIDKLGWFSEEPYPLTLSKFLGIILLIVAIVLIQSDRKKA